MNALHISIYGRVQAVGFRNWIKENADSRKLSGWARNASDGSVEVFLQGDEDLINELPLGLRLPVFDCYKLLNRPAK